MKIKNESDKTILVYFYKPEDTVYWVALAEIIIESGETGEYREDSFDKVKVKVIDKSNDAVLLKAGEIFDMAANYVFTKENRLIKASVELNEEIREKGIIKDYVFFDATGYNEKTVRTITSYFSSSYSQSESLGKSYSHTQEFTVGGELGGWIGNKEKGGVSANVSSGFRDVVEKSLAESYQSSISKVWSKSTSDEFTFLPGKIYLIEVIWEVELITGLAKFFGEQTSFTVIDAVKDVLTKSSAFDAVNDMGKEIKELYTSLEKRKKIQA